MNFSTSLCAHPTLRDWHCELEEIFLAGEFVAQIYGHNNGKNSTVYVIIGSGTLELNLGSQSPGVIYLVFF